MQIVIPARNEETRLPGTLTALRTYALSTAPTPGPIEVLVVDNGSTDSTARVALAADSAAMRVRVIDCRRPGKGAAVRAGFAATTADLVAFMDADGATSLAALAQAADLVSHGADVAVGSRAMRGSVTTERHSRLRAGGARLYRGLAGRLVPGVRDTQCGFKVMRGALAREVLAHTRTDGFSFDVELLALAQARGARIVEFPVTWVDVPGSTFSVARHGLRSFAELAAISWRLHHPAPPAAVRVVPLRPAIAPILEPVLEPVAGA